MRKYDVKKMLVEQEIKKTIGYVCDVCEKDIKINEVSAWDNSNIYKGFEVKVGHHDWGNDSVESIEYRHICEECLTKDVENYFKDKENWTTTKYYEIRTLFNGDE